MVRSEQQWRDRESFIAIYERLFDLYDRLHRESPDLFIDCTFETAGKLQLIDEGFRVEIPEKYGRRIYEIGMAH